MYTLTSEAVGAVTVSSLRTNCTFKPLATTGAKPSFFSLLELDDDSSLREVEDRACHELDEVEAISTLELDSSTLEEDSSTLEEDAGAVIVAVSV